MALPATHAPSPCRLGVLAFGDSITNGGGELQWGVALQSWAWWTARGLGLPFTSYAADGARAREVIDRQIPALKRSTALPDGRYHLGCLYVGVNDVRSLDWNRAEFEVYFRAALAFLAPRCDRIVALTAPLDLGRPRARDKVRELNATVCRLADEHSAIVVDLSDFRGRNHVMTDHVHPTAFGQIAIAERVLEVLERHGVSVGVRPSSLIAFETTRFRRLRSDATYVYRHAKVSLRSLAARTQSSRASS